MFKIFVFCLAFSLQLAATHDGPDHGPYRPRQLHTEIGLSPMMFDTGQRPLTGARLTINCYLGPEEARELIWAGDLSFKPPVPIRRFTEFRKLYRPLIELRMVQDAARYQETFRGAIPIRNAGEDEFNYFIAREDDFNFIARELARELDGTGRQVHNNLVSWRLPIALSAREVIDAVNAQKRHGNFPKYKGTGYDCDDYVANSVVFSCHVLQTLGININACENLRGWLEPTPMSGFMKFAYYGLGWGWTRDFIDLERPLIAIARNRDRVRWTRGEYSSGMPRFNNSRLHKAGIGLRVEYEEE